MIKFDKESFAQSLEVLPFPVAHTVFLEEQTCWSFTQKQNRRTKTKKL